MYSFYWLEFFFYEKNYKENTYTAKFYLYFVKFKIFLKLPPCALRYNATNFRVLLLFLINYLFFLMWKDLRSKIWFILYRQIYFRFLWIQPKLNCIYHFPINLETRTEFRLVQNQSEKLWLQFDFGWFDKNRSSVFVCSGNVERFDLRGKVWAINKENDATEWRICGYLWSIYGWFMEDLWSIYSWFMNNLWQITSGALWEFDNTYSPLQVWSSIILINRGFSLLQVSSSTDMILQELMAHCKWHLYKYYTSGSYGLLKSLK